MPARLRIAGRTTSRARADPDLEPALERALGAAHDAARRACSTPPRYNLAHGAERRGAVRVRARVYLARGRAAERGRRSAASSPASGRRRRTSPGGSPRWLAGRSAGRLARRRVPSRTSTPLKGVLEALAAQLGVEVDGRAGRGAVPAPGPRRPGAGRRARDAGWLGEIHPLVCRDVGPRERAAGFELDLGAARRGLAARARALRGRDHLSRPSTRTSRSSSTTRSRPRAVSTRSSPGGGELLRSASRSSTSTAASSSARGARASRCGSSSARPTGRSPTRRSPSVRERDHRPRCARDRRVRSVSDGDRSACCVAGASGYAGALAAELVWRHPRLELRGRRPRAPTPGRRLDELYPALPRAARARGARPRAARATSTRRSSPTRTAPPRRWSRQLRELGHPGRRPLRRLPAARPRRSTSAGTARTARRSCSTTPSTGCTELHRERDRAAPSWSPTRAATRPRRSWRSRRSPSAGLIDDVVVDAKSRRLRRRARRRRATRTSSTVDENVSPYGVERPPPRARDRPGAGARSGCGRRRRHLRPASAAARPGPARELLRDATASSRADELAALYAERYADEPFVELRRRAARRARRARHQPLPDPRGVDPRRAGARVRRDRQPLEGRRGAGDPEPEPDARASTRGRGSAVSARADGDRFFRSRWVDAAGRGRGARARPRWRPGSGPPASPAGSRAAGRPTSACWPATPTGRLRAAAHPQRRRRGAGPGLPRRAATRGAIRAAVGQLGQRQRRHRRAGLSRTRSRCATPRPRRSALEPARRSRSPRPATIGVPLRVDAVVRGDREAAGGALDDGGGDFSARDHDHRPLAEALRGARRRRHASPPRRRAPG